MDSKAPVPQNTLASRLNQPVRLSRRQTRYPSKKKTTMNLYVKAVSTASVLKSVLGILIVALVAAAIAKFGILDRLDQVAAERVQLESHRAQLSAVEAQLADFDKIQENYQRYTKKYQTSEEAALLDRLMLVEVFDSKARGLVQVSSIAIAGSNATVTILADTLAQVAQYKLVLQQNEHFTTADVYDARTLEDQETLVQYVTATIVLTLTQEVAE